MPSNRITAAWTAIALLALAAASAADPVNRRIVALSGTDGPLGPGLAPGVTFTSLDFAVGVDEVDGIVFSGGLAGPGIQSTNNGGVWRDRAGERAAILRKGDLVPAVSPQAYVSSLHVAEAALSRDGRYAVHGLVRVPGPTVILSALWAENEHGVMELIARESQPAPGASDGILFDDFDQIAAGSNGNFAFEARLRDAQSTSYGIWAYRDGTLHAVAIEDHPAPPPGVTYRGISTSPPQPNMNPVGDIAYFASVNRDEMPPTSGIFIERDGAAQALILEDDAAPGVETAATFWSLHQRAPSINTHGSVAFHAMLEGPGVVDENRHGIWSDHDGPLSLIVRSGDPAPGLEPNGVFTYVEQAALNDSGEIVFYGFDSNLLINGYWRANGGLISSVVVDETHPAGTPQGSIIDVQLESGMINNAGQVALFAGFEPAGDERGLQNVGVWLINRAGSQTLAFRTGQLIEVAPGDVRMIAEFQPSWRNPSPSSGQARSFNDAGTVVASVKFTDGSSAVIAATAFSFCSADTNGDGIVNFADINEVLGAFNTAVLEPHYDFDADLDFDGKVDFADLNLVISQLGDDCGG